jgi:hypothetical protein
MQPGLSLRMIARLVALPLAAAIALPFVAPTSAAGQVPQSPKGWNRQVVIENAQRWVDHQVGYSQTSWYRGYRQDCSGFVSMAWNLHASYPTGMMNQIAKPIPKDALLPGDVLLNNTSSYAHVVLFEKWAYTDRSWYVGYEQIGSAGHPVRRLIPYPYFRHGELYTPYRFTGLPPKPQPRPKPAPPRPGPAHPATRSAVATRTAQLRSLRVPVGYQFALALVLAGTLGLAWGISGRGIR